MAEIQFDTISWTLDGNNDIMPLLPPKPFNYPDVIDVRNGTIFGYDLQYTGTMSPGTFGAAANVHGIGNSGGTSATFTVSASPSPTASNEVFYSRYAADNLTLNWISAGTVVGNGTITINLVENVYVCKVQTTQVGTIGMQLGNVFTLFDSLDTRRVQRIIEDAARNFVRKCERRGVQVWWVNNCGDAGVKVWAMRSPFSRGLGLLGPDLDVERTTFFIPRQYDETGALIFPVTLSGGAQDVSVSSRIYYNGKLYEVDMVTGDVEGMPETAVFRCDVFYRMYNNTTGTWTPPT